MNTELIIALASVAVPLVGALAWLFKMAGDVSANKEKLLENKQDIEKVDNRVAKLEDRHDLVANEMRTILRGIEKSLGNLEGRLSIPLSKNE